MAPRLPEIAVLEELAEELERWSAFAQGALDDATHRHRRTHEQLLRAERTSALGKDSLRTDTERLAEVGHTLTRLEDETSQLLGDLDRARGRLDVVIAAAQTMRIELDAARRSNEAEQERCAGRLSIATRDDQRARMGLHESLELLRTTGRTLRRRRSNAAQVAFGLAEQEAHRAARALADTRFEFDSLEKRRSRICDGILELEADLERAASSVAQVELGLRSATRAKERLTSAREAEERAARALERSTHADEELSRALEQCREHFTVATERSLAAGVTYEQVQRLTIEVAHDLRDTLTNEGAYRRGRDDGADHG